MSLSFVSEKVYLQDTASTKLAQKALESPISKITALKHLGKINPDYKTSLEKEFHQLESIHSFINENFKTEEVEKLLEMIEKPEFGSLSKVIRSISKQMKSFEDALTPQVAKKINDERMGQRKCGALLKSMMNLEFHNYKYTLGKMILEYSGFNHKIVQICNEELYANVTQMTGITVLNQKWYREEHLEYSSPNIINDYYHELKPLIEKLFIEFSDEEVQKMVHLMLEYNAVCPKFIEGIVNIRNNVQFSIDRKLRPLLWH